MAWEQLDNIPTTTQTGTRIAGGKSGYHYYAWGIFPYGSYTRFGYARVDITGHPQWTLDVGNIVPYLENTSATYRWQGNVEFFFSGHAYNGNKLYLCGWGLNPSSVDLPSGAAPGEGSCITYVPNGSYGYVYYLSKSNAGYFGRYSLATADNVVVDGICPGESAITGDSTPLFQWGSTATIQYRLVVASDSLFGDTVIDEAVSSPAYQTTTALTNGPYYWRSAARAGGAWSWSGIHNFRVDYGWTQLDNMTDNTGGVGASMAYKDYFANDGHHAILLLVGGGSTDFLEYNLQSGHWNSQLASTPVAYPQYEGTSLTTQDPTGQGGLFAWASFGGQQASDDVPYYYDAWQDEWYPWINGGTPYYSSPYPENINYNASMVFGEHHVLYLTTNNEFFRVDPPPDDILMTAEGEMASGSCVQKTQAHVVTRRCGFGVEYQLSKTAHVRAMLHDAVGRQVGTLDVGEQKPGSHRLCWNTDGQGRKLSAGAYFVLLEIGTEEVSLKAIVR